MASFVQPNSVESEIRGICLIQIAFSRFLVQRAPEYQYEIWGRAGMMANYCRHGGRLVAARAGTGWGHLKNAWPVSLPVLRAVAVTSALL
eukprot:1220537-Pleurochrysis_carterae.AAC.1